MKVLGLIALAILSGNAFAEIPGLVDTPLALSPNVYPRYLTRYRDKIWYSDERFTPHTVGYIGADASVHSFPVPCGGCGTGSEIVYIAGLTPGPDGAIWFAYAHAKSDGSPIDSWVGRVTESGTFTAFATPTKDAFRRYFNGYGHSDITLGPDGNLWFTENAVGKIGKVTPQGAFIEYALPSALSSPTKIVSGPDGNLWFTESFSGKVGRMTTAGVLTEFPLPGASTAFPWGITVGRDGALWITELGANAVTRVTTGGAVTRYPLPVAGSQPEDIELGPDGAIWFGLWGAKQLGRIETSAPLTVASSAAPHALGSMSFTAPLRAVSALAILWTHVVGMATAAKILDSEYDSASGADAYSWSVLTYTLASQLVALSVDRVNGQSAEAGLMTAGACSGLVDLGFAAKGATVGFDAEFANPDDKTRALTAVIHLASALQFAGLRTLRDPAAGALAAANGSADCSSAGNEVTCNVTIAPQAVYDLRFDTTVTGTGTAVTSIDVTSTDSPQPVTRAYGFVAAELPTPATPPRRRSAHH